MPKLTVLLLLGSTALISCEQPHRAPHADETMVSLYQFDGQHVEVSACGEPLISNSILTDEATGHSVSTVFTKRDGCKLIVKIGSEFDETYDLSVQTNYVLITYTGNPDYVDGLEECGAPCVGYVIEQFEEAPLLD